MESQENAEMRKAILLLTASLGLLVFICSMGGCTLSFQNVMTSGVSSDVVDSEPKTDAQVIIPLK